MKILAKVISSYHIELLLQNGIKPKYFLINGKDERLLKLINENFKKVDFIFFDSERKEFNIFSSRRFNKKLYKTSKEKLLNINFDCLILFTDNKPFDKFLIDFGLDNKVIIELWEDGLGHYIGAGTSKFFFKNIIKFFLGYYSKSILSDTYKRDQIIIKNRFDKKNIIYNTNFESNKKPISNKGILFIGQPLVEDGYISSANYINKILDIQTHFNIKVNYLPHPRENLDKYKETKFTVVTTKMNAENYCVINKYEYYISAFSTTLLNINQFNNSYYIPSYFGLNKIHKLLKGLSFLPILVANNLEDVK
ncbi:polysialyltransferase family glycosyltransferase [Algibacter sp. R77976]|uniref:polysialyltransferase family glycosyltransferase n=1 Tax=Algibacter sp. R77976 TaxID=3093873 RepID=UPI0037C9F95B